MTHDRDPVAPFGPGAARYRHPSTRAHHVLITGATGSLGREVLSRLLDRSRGRAPAGRVTLLIRGRDDDIVRGRLAELARYLRRWRPSLDLSTVSAVRADVAGPELGLDRRTRAALASDVTHIVHSAATIELNQPIERARATNLRGTEAILNFAERCPGLARLVHVSTAYVAGDRSGVITEDELDCGQAFLNGYERSKFEAEVSVRERMGDLPISVVRPSILVGDSRDGHAAALTTIFPVLRHVASGRLRRFPGYGTTLLDLVPVDYVADAIVHLLCSARSEGGTFHLTAGAQRGVPVRRLFEMTVEMFGRHPAPALSFDGECRSASDPQSRRLHERLHCYFDYLFGCKIFDDSHYRRLAGSETATCPDPWAYLPRVLSFAGSTLSSGRPRANRSQGCAPARADTRAEPMSCQPVAGSP